MPSQMPPENLLPVFQSWYVLKYHFFPKFSSFLKRFWRKGHADKKLDREGARMYTYEERMRAVKAYIASGYQANKTIQELGYPSHEALRGWYREYQKNGDLHRDFIRAPLHTREQKAKAVAHYYAHGCKCTKASKALGYVNRDRLGQWVLETRPAEGQSCTPRRNVAKCKPEQKREAVVEFCARGGSAEKIANRYGVSHSNLYCWQEKLFAGESRDEMQKPEEPITEAARHCGRKMPHWQKGGRRCGGRARNWREHATGCSWRQMF